jgi:RHS repeat-associated protein
LHEYATRACSSPSPGTWAGGLPLLLQDRVASYIYGPGGQILEQVQGTNAYYYHADQLGSVRALTDQSKAVVATYTYDAYGQHTASTGSAPNPFRYAGQYRDAESGLYYLRARYYDPATQQFLTVDPALAATEQAYAYAAGSPLNATDPSGLKVALGDELGGSGGGIGGLPIIGYTAAGLAVYGFAQGALHWPQAVPQGSVPGTQVEVRGKKLGWGDLPWKRKGQKAVEGKLFYEPPCDNPTEDSAKAPGGGGYIDADGNEWRPDLLHGGHWDVQLGRNAQRRFGRRYLNVTDDGTIKWSLLGPTPFPLPPHR